MMGDAIMYQGQISPQERAAFARRTMRVLQATPTQELRVSYLRAVLIEQPTALVAEGLDEIVTLSEQGEGPALDVLVSFVTLLQQSDIQPHVLRLRRLAREGPLYGLSQFLPDLGTHDAGELHADGQRKGTERDRRVPDYGKGRALTLGERKSLARKPDRAMLDRLLNDPHPVVIRHVLRNPKTTEDDVVRLAARRPLASSILREIAANTRWSHRPRVRMAVVLNPSCPVDLSLSLVQLLRRSELRVLLGVGECRPELIRLARVRLQRAVEAAREAEDDTYN